MAGGKVRYSMEPGTMISLLTESDDWGQSRSAVAHLYYSVVSSGEDAGSHGRRRVQVVRNGNPTNPGDAAPGGRLYEPTHYILLEYMHTMSVD